MAHILFLTQVLPYPLDAGPKIRAYYVLRHLAAKHAVTLVSFVRGDDRPECIAHLASFCAAIHTMPMRRSRLRDVSAVARAALTGESILIVRDRVPEMRTLLRELVQQTPYDVIHADQTSMAQYALYAHAQHLQARGGVARPKLVLDVHNALYRVPEQISRLESRSLRGLLLRREAPALRRYELATYEQFDYLVFVTEEDRQALGWSGDSSLNHSAVIPICNDREARSPIAMAPDPHYITHLGTMFWPPNIEGVLWFAREVFPLVLQKFPEARLAIIGKRPPRRVQELSERQPAIEVLGYVPDPEPYLAQTAAFIVPLRAGAGMRVKILDAWGWGVPVVSTTLGAEGIAVRDGENALLADSAAAFAEAVVRLLREPALRDRLRQNGRRHLIAHYDWQTVYRRWDRVYERLVG